MAVPGVLEGAAGRGLDAEVLPPQELVRAGWARLATVLGPLLAGLLAFGLVLYQLSRPDGLYRVTQYDDGTYLGAAVRLLHGQLPYRDFVLVQPPGITLLLSPVALLAEHVGTRAGLGVARVLTGAVAGLNAYLAGRLLAHRGAVAALVAALALAVQPVAFFADRTLLLEPYLVLLCLIGARLAFRGDRLAGPWRLAFAGACLGLGGAVKSWAVVPAAALALAALARSPGEAEERPVGGWRRGVLPLVGGTAGGFALPCLPFFLAAPQAFVQQVVLAQLGRTGGRTPLLGRLVPLVGLPGVDGVKPTWNLALLLAAVIGAVLLAGTVLPVLARRGGAFERFVVLGAAGATAAVLVPAQFFYHYCYFPAGFVALALGAVAGRVAGGARRLLGRSGGLVPLAAGLAALALAAGLTWLVPAEARYDAAATETGGDPALAIDLAIPAGACAISDAAILLVEADRFVSRRPGCPDVVDATGTWLTVSPKLVARGCGPVDPALVARWRRWLAGAGYFVESGESALRVPWTRGLRAWFSAHYVRVPDPGVSVYVRRGLPGEAALLAPARWTPARLAAEGYLRRRSSTSSSTAAARREAAAKAKACPYRPS